MKIPMLLKEVADMKVFLNIAICICTLMLYSGTAVCAEEKLALTVLVDTVKDMPVLRGETLEKPDALDPSRKTVSAYRPTTEIISVGNQPGGNDYKIKEDFLPFNNWAIQWLPEGKHPEPGATYFVSFKYVLSEKGHNTTGHGTGLADGKLTAGWRDKAPSWIYVDLGEEKSISRVVIHQPAQDTPKYLSRKITVQFAAPKAVDLNDEKVWVDAVSSDAAIKNPLHNVMNNKIDFRIVPVKSRYCRLFVEEGAANNYARINELELFGP